MVRRGVTDLPPDAKLGEMQENADCLVQLIGAATPDVPNQTPMPQTSKQLLNAPGVTMMLHATKRGFKDCPGFLNSTGRLGPKRGWKCYVTPAFSGVPNKGDKIRSQNLRYDAPSIPKCGSLVQPGAQIAALC